MDHLKHLIESLSSREKSYFKKTYRESSNKNFYRLYLYLIKNPKADLQRVKVNFADEGIGRNTNYEVNQLYQKILRALNIFRMSSPAPDIQILQILQHIVILIEKQQWKHARKLVLKAKKIAYEFEEFAILIKIIGIQEELEFAQIDSDIAKNIQKFDDERNEINDRISEYNRLKLLKIKFVDFQFSVGLITSSSEQFPALFDNPLLSAVQHIKSNKSKDLWYFCKSMSYSLVGDYELSKDIREQRLAFIRKNKNMISDSEEIIALNNYLFLMVQMRSKVDFDIKHGMLLDFLDSRDVSSGIVLFFSYYLRLAMYITLESKHQIRKIFSEVFEYTLKKSSEMNPTQVYYLFFYLTKASITINDYGQALDVLNLWSHYKTDGIRYVRFKILWLLTHFSLGNHLLLSNELYNLKRSIREKKIENGNLSIVIEFITKVITEPSQEKIYLQEMEDAYNAIHSEIPAYYIRVYEIDLAAWVTGYSTYRKTQ